MASCPTAAIRPATVDGNPSVEVIEEQLHVLRELLLGLPGDADQRSAERRRLDLGRRQGLQRPHEPMFSKLAIPFLPNNPPRWPEVTEAVRNIVEVWAANARKYERMGELIERIGWPKFFELTGIEFEKEHIDDFKHAGLTFKRSTHLTY